MCVCVCVVRGLSYVLQYLYDTARSETHMRRIKVRKNNIQHSSIENYDSVSTTRTRTASAAPCRACTCCGGVGWVDRLETQQAIVYVLLSLPARRGDRVNGTLVTVLFHRSVWRTRSRTSTSIAVVRSSFCGLIVCFEEKKNVCFYDGERSSIVFTDGV